MRQSVEDGQKLKNCGASRNAIGMSAASKFHPGWTRNAATNTGMAMMAIGAKAVGAALYQRIFPNATDPNCQFFPVRRGIRLIDDGRANVIRPAQKWASSWQKVPASVNRKKKGCFRARKRMINASTIEGAR